MINKLLCIIVLSAVLGLADSGAQTAPSKVKGEIIAARVQGHVTAISNSTQKSRLLRDGDRVSDQTTIVTGTGASVILAFSNGATVSIAGDSKLDIAEFEQDPFSNNVKASDVKQETGTSVTKLDLTRGELVGKVAHLNVDKGSEFTVRTPVGAAGIRGTVLGAVFHPLEGQKARFEARTFEGLLAFAAGGGEPVLIPAGNKLDFVFNYNPKDVENPWGWVAPPPPSLKVISITPGEAEQFRKELKAIEEAIDNISFDLGLNPPPPPPPAPPMNAPTPGAGTAS